MTNIEIINLAIYGINAKIDKEEKYNKEFLLEHGCDSKISKNRLERYNKQFVDLYETLSKIENDLREIKRLSK